MARPGKILIVEDEPQIARLITLHLQDAGYETVTAASCTTGRKKLEAGGWDLLILDRMLPDGDGLDLCREMRQGKSPLPVLVLTARGEEVDRVLGLELGADDYLTKPFSVRELVARVKAILRRVEARVAPDGGSPTESLTTDGLTIDRQRHSVSLNGEEVHLTAKEFDLLLHFATNPGRVYSRSQLLDAVWGYGAGAYEHTVNSHINRLRAKIEDDPSNPRFIQTVWGVGYRFLEDSEAEG